ncbi:hypothetical protein FBR07_01250 [Candidatus Uhrbacteria bacterium UHB]|nr:hypothetical protein [Candidatus Uhrbacteria bacterium UHB]RIL01030.1 MAG: hypothetical protein DCC77_00615 [Candidatus Uhrbacteria bacterium]
MHIAKLFVYDEFNPQDVAMMQALYSRSAESVETHAEKVKSSGSGKFMETYYVNYGHASIADCGSTTLFIEGVSMLAAKAIQDWPLYSGQETSTRYIDMSKQAILDPVGTRASDAILKRWMEFYISSQNRVSDHLRRLYPRKEDEKEPVYDKAIKARTFDVLRSFLPAGVTTQLSWHTNLRQGADKLALLRHHPLPEIRSLAHDMHARLLERYPNSFSHKRYEETEAYYEDAGRDYMYYRPSHGVSHRVVCSTMIGPEQLKRYEDLITRRPPKTNLPHFLSELGPLTFEFLLDFGSFRDLQRHRNGVCRMPLITGEYGFHPWYLEQLPEDLRRQAERLIQEQLKDILELDASPETKQYYFAMGFAVPCKVSYGLPATVYVVELRSGKTVHPTMRRIAHGMAARLKERFPNLVLHADLDADDWDIRRGLQDITKKHSEQTA